jgi:hypothetical protein
MHLRDASFQRADQTRWIASAELHPESINLKKHVGAELLSQHIVAGSYAVQQVKLKSVIVIGELSADFAVAAARFIFSAASM